MYTEKQLLEHLKDRWWRLNNLYWIKPKQGRSSELVLFQPNWAQKELYDNLWYRNTILKARQLGVTTYWSIFFLDDCIFNANREAGIIADTRENAEEIFTDYLKSEELKPQDKFDETPVESDEKQITSKRKIIKPQSKL